MKTIVAATDFSAWAHSALERAAQIARASGAELHLLHVMELPIQWQMAAEVAMVSGPMDDAGLRARAETELAGLLTRDERAKYRAVYATETGAPFAAIVR